MQFIQGINRHQTYFSTLEDQVSANGLLAAVSRYFAFVSLLKCNSVKIACDKFLNKIILRN